MIEEKLKEKSVDMQHDNVCCSCFSAIESPPALMIGLEDAIAICKSEIAGAKPKWISTKDKLPVFNTEVLVSYKHEEIPIQAFYNSGKWYGSREVTDWMQEGYVENRLLCSQESITHWMPLPESPEGKL